MAIDEEDYRPPLPERPLLASTSSPRAHEDERLPSTQLQRAPGMVVNCVLYAALAVAAWVILCITAQRPINAHSFTYDRTWAADHADKFQAERKLGSYGLIECENYIKAARVMQALVGILTIPLTSAVCSRASVVYLQRKADEKRGPTMRQAMALADKSWTEPWAVLKMLLTRRWKRKGSGFFGLAVLLTLLGSIISPLTAILVSYKTKHILRDMDDLTVPDLFDALSRTETSKEYYVTSLRSSLASAQKSDVQSTLWSNTSACDKRTGAANGPSVKCDASSQNTVKELVYLQDPFWAPLPFKFNTGAMTQFAPRLNSSAQYQDWAGEPLPPSCHLDTRPEAKNATRSALLIQYSVGDRDLGYNVTFCVPDVYARSPWVTRRRRQDFTEELYIDASFGGPIPDGLSSARYTARITMDTTAGYFRLPNYAHPELFGPLLGGGEDPVVACNDTQSCEDQWHDVWVKEGTLNARSWGPLATLALVLFGKGSFMDDGTDIKPGGWDSCLQVAPLWTFFDERQQCLQGMDEESVFSGRRAYLSHFLSSGANKTTIEIAMDAGAFLVHNAWMAASSRSMKIRRLTGPDIQAPDLSATSKIILSVLLGVFLLSLLGMSVFSALTPCWTEKLDSFAMLRIGATIPERFPLLVSYRPDHIDVLDQTPGWVGHVAGHEGDEKQDVCELGLGATARLRPRVRYRCYNHDDEVVLPSLAAEGTLREA